jgi:Tol biopolymer transport system component
MNRMMMAAAAAVMWAQQPAPHEMPQEMVWVDRGGKVLGTVGARQMSMFFPELSPDGKFIAVSARDGEVNDRDIWVHDVAAGTKRAVAPAKGNDNFPLWSPDGKQIIFTSSRLGNYELYRKDLEPDRPEVLIYKREGSQYPRSWSPTGKWLLFTHADTKRDLLLWEIGEDKPPVEMFPSATAWSESARFSPNGLYIAYVSNAEGPFEIYVAATREPRKRWKVSRPLGNGWAGGGGQVRWRADGRELFYMLGNDTMLSVEVSTEGEFQHQTPKRLFALAGMKGNFPEESPWVAKYDVTADGQRFVFVRTVRK